MFVNLIIIRVIFVIFLMMYLGRELLASGVWDDDINSYPHKEYTFDSHGYKCKVKRNDFWAWCGYVTVDESHPYYGNTNGDISDNLDVHGGITYQTDDTFGFDCCHYKDIWPYRISGLNFNDPNGHYWTFDDVKQETIKLASQLQTLAGK